MKITSSTKYRELTSQVVAVVNVEIEEQIDSPEDIKRITDLSVKSALQQFKFAKQAVNPVNAGKRNL